MENDVLRHDARLKLSLEAEMHCLRNLEQQFAGAHDKTRISVADAGGKLVECACHAGVRVGAEKNFAGTSVAFLRESGMANSRKMGAVLFFQRALARIENPVTVRVIDHVVEIRK